MLDVLIATAIKRVKDTPFTKPQPPKPSPAVREWLRVYRRADKQRDRAKSQLKRHGWEVSYRNKLDSLDARGQAVKQRFDAENERRLTKIRNLRDNALLDTIGLEPLELKTYLIALKKKLEKI